MNASIQEGTPAPVVEQAAVINEDWAKPPTLTVATPAKPPAARSSRQPATAPVQLLDPTVRKAVAATLAERPAPSSIPPNQHEARVLSAESSYKKFANEFSNARIPGCLDPDALKLQPPRIGSINFGGLLALPFLVVAAARGKCK
jgi:hypothetical protein